MLIPSGTANASTLENIKSTHKANIQAGIAPAKIIVLFTVCTPENTKYPSPPAPTNADKVIRPTADTADILTPAIITGSARGSCILKSICLGVKPIPVADSRIPESIPVIPVLVFFTIGSSEYKTTINIAGVLPIPKTGTSKPRNAIDGTACTIFIKPSIYFLIDL